MGDKRLMDNKVVKNPLLSGVDQTSFIQDFVQSTLIVPAAPPRILQTTDETKSGSEKSEKKEIVTGEIKTDAASVPTIPTYTNLGGVTEQNQPLAQPILLPPQQNISHIPSDNSATLSEIPLNRIPTIGSFPKQPTRESSAVSPNPTPPPVKTGGPPPLTSYNRPQSKLASSRYPSASFLQTIPSAQFFSQNNPNTSSVLPSNASQNFPNPAYSTPVNYFVPQPQILEQSVSFSTSSSSVSDTTLISDCSQKYNFPFFKSNENLNSSVPSAESVLQEVDSSILTPVSIQQPLISSIPPTLHNFNSENQFSNSIPSLPVSQPVIIPSTSTVLFPSTSNGSSLAQTTFQSPISSVVLNSQPITSPPNWGNSSHTVSTSSSSVLRSASSSPLLSSKAVPVSSAVGNSSPALEQNIKEDSKAFNETPKVETFNNLVPVSTPQISPENFPSTSDSEATLNTVPSSSLPASQLSEEKPLIHQVTSNPVDLANQPPFFSSSSSIPAAVASSTESKVDVLQQPAEFNLTASSDSKQVEVVSSQESVNQSAPPAALFTFPNSTATSNLSESLTHPPILPYNDNKFSILGKHNKQFLKPHSVSTANNYLGSVAPLSKDQTLPTSSSPSPTPPTSESTVSSSSTVPLLDPSKFFTTSPPLTQQFLNPSQLLLNSSKPFESPTYPPLPVRNFTTPSSPSWQNSFPPSIAKSETLITKDSSQDISTVSRSSPPVKTSHTPPPPYSSLSTSPLTVDQRSIPSNLTQLQADGGITNQPENSSAVKEEELDQIPLDGNAVPLYNPQSVKPVSNHNLAPLSLGSSNTYRLGSGLKRPSYAPVPDLGISQQVNQAFPMMSGSPPLQNPPPTITTAYDKIPSTPRSLSMTSSSPPSESTQYPYSVTAQGLQYRPAYHHWFYKKGGEKKAQWQPFTMADSLNLEQVFTSPDLDENSKVPTDGGRYDVEVVHRKKVPVYWEEPPGEVRRCSWFVRAPIESRYIPYDENIAEILEDAYRTGCLKNEWNRRVELADGEVIILHSPNAMAHHQRSTSPDAWGNPPTMPQKPRIVKRGLEDFEISEGEPNQVDHLLLMVHGIGKVCDLRFRSLVQVVDDFRSVSLQLIQSHFRGGTENGNVGRVEVLPVEWHRALHTETIDKRLADITLPSIPKAREFTNDVLLDILFYTSPVFCERIVQAVGAEINRVYNLYMTRNPGFRGGVSLGGHSLGSLILFDMLCHQRPQPALKSSHAAHSSSIQESDEDMPELGCLKTKARLSRRMSYLTIAGSAGTGQPYIAYPQLNFQPKAFFALGSPIGMFLTVRGLEGLGEDFKFPTCPKFFNIFHPNDPVAYRIEALVSPEMVGVPAVVIPHHKGRKRMHLELKDTMAHVTAALKQKLIDSMRSTWNTVYQLAMFQRPDSSIQQEVDKVIENEILTNSDCETNTSNHLVMSEQDALNLKVGSLNGGDRIDYVLQEAPLETFNQYISAVRSHVVYWESEDTMLLILKELYATLGISPDSQVPQPILPFDLSSETGNETYSEYTDSIGAPPTQFIRK